MATERRRRQHGTGSVHQRASDRRWIGTIEAGWTARGTRRRVTVSAACPCRGQCRGPGRCPGEAECRRRLTAKQRQIAAEGLPSAGANPTETVRTFAERWLAERELDGAVRSSTWRTDASMVRTHIIPSIGQRKIAALDVDAVHKVQRDAAHLADSSLVRLRATLGRLLRDARQAGHPIPERVLDVPRPSAGDSDRDAMPEADALAVLAVALNRPDASRWAFGLLYGTRQAETLGLTWDAVDFDRGLIDTSWQLQPVRYRHGCGAPTSGRYPCGRRFGGDCPSRALHRKRGDTIRQLDGALCLVQPKTAAGRRVHPLLPWMAQALADWRAIAPTSPHGLVWPRPDGRPALARDDDAAWRDIQDAAQVARVYPDPVPHPDRVLDGRGPALVGRRYTIHEARHTVATLLERTGATEGTAAAILGQSKLLRRYVHVTPADKAAALAPVAELLGLTAERS